MTDSNNKRNLIENIINNNLYDDEIILLLIETLQVEDKSLSEIAMFALINAPDIYRDGISEKVTPLIRSESINIRNWTCELILKLGLHSIPFLLLELKHQSADVRKFACDLIGQIGILDNLIPIYELLNDENENVVLSAIETLGCLNDSNNLDHLIEIYNGKEYTRVHIIEAFGRIGGYQIEHFLIETLEVSDDELIRTLCVEALAQCATSKELCDNLQELLYTIKDSLKGTILKAYVAISQRNGYYIFSSPELKKIAYIALNDDDDEIKLSALVALGDNYNEEDVKILASLKYFAKLPIMIQIIYFNLLNNSEPWLIELFFRDFFQKYMSFEGIIDTISNISVVWDDLINVNKSFIIEIIFKDLFEINTSVCNDVYDFFNSLDSESTAFAVDNLSKKGILIQQ